MVVTHSFRGCLVPSHTTDRNHFRGNGSSLQSRKRTILVPGAGESTTNHLDIGGATNKPRAPSRFGTAAELTTTSKISSSVVSTSR